MIICIGPVCIPLWGVLPFIFALLVQAKDSILVFLGLKKPNVAVVHPSHHAQPPPPPPTSSSSSSKPSEDHPSSAPLLQEEEDTSSAIISPTTREEFAAALSLKPLAIIDFGASWCIPCKRIAPVFADECRQYGQYMTFIKVDVDELDEVAAEYKVTALPCFVILENGRVLATDLSGSNEQALRSFIASHIKVE